MSFDKKKCTRNILENAVFLQDEYGNQAGTSQTGAKLQVSIVHQDKSSGELPVFVGNSSNVTVPLQKGRVTLQVRQCSGL